MRVKHLLNLLRNKLGMKIMIVLRLMMSLRRISDSIKINLMFSLPRPCLMLGRLNQRFPNTLSQTISKCQSLSVRSTMHPRTNLWSNFHSRLPIMPLPPLEMLVIRNPHIVVGIVFQILARVYSGPTSDLVDLGSQGICNKEHSRSNFPRRIYCL